MDGEWCCCACTTFLKDRCSPNQRSSIGTAGQLISWRSSKAMAGETASSNGALLACSSTTDCSSWRPKPRKFQLQALPSDFWLKNGQRMVEGLWGKSNYCASVRRFIDPGHILQQTNNQGSGWHSQQWSNHRWPRGIRQRNTTDRIAKNIIWYIQMQ